MVLVCEIDPGKMAGRKEDKNDFSRYCWEEGEELQKQMKTSEQTKQQIRIKGNMHSRKEILD